MLYQVNMKFSRPPEFQVTVEAPNIVTAKVVAQHNALVGGFGKARKMVVKELK